MSARDELALDIFLADNWRASAPIAIEDWDALAKSTQAGQTYCHHIADRLITAGYRKPRTITTVEELDALPDGSIVTADWATHQRILGQWATFGSPATSQPELPATVLHEPEAEVGA